MTGPLREEIVSQLRQQLATFPTDERDASDLISTGAAALDRLLPRGGLAPGTLVEWLAPGPGSGASTLALLTALAACQKRGALVVCDYLRHWNPWICARGADSLPVVVLRPPTLADQWWAAEQALRSPAVAAVWLPCVRVDARDFRRLQLAAEAGGSLGLLLRPARSQSEPSWADVRLLVESRPGVIAGRRLRVTVLRCRGGGEGRSVELVLDDRARQLRIVRDTDETLPVPAISALADSAPGRRWARA